MTNSNNWLRFRAAVSAKSAFIARHKIMIVAIAAVLCMLSGVAVCLVSYSNKVARASDASSAATVNVGKKCSSPTCQCQNCTGACGGNCTADGNGNCSSCSSGNICGSYTNNFYIDTLNIYNYVYNVNCNCSYCKALRCGEELPTCEQTTDASGETGTSEQPTVPEDHVNPNGTVPATVPVQPTQPAESSAEQPAKTREITGITATLGDYGKVYEGQVKLDWCNYIFVKAVYSDGTQEDISGWYCPEANQGNIAGNVTFHISWNGYTCEVVVTILKRPNDPVTDPTWGDNPITIDPAWEESVSASASQEAAEQEEPENIQPSTEYQERTTASPTETLPASEEATTTATATTTAAEEAKPTYVEDTPAATTIPETTSVEVYTVDSNLDDDF